MEYLLQRDDKEGGEQSIKHPLQGAATSRYDNICLIFDLHLNFFENVLVMNIPGIIVYVTPNNIKKYRLLFKFNALLHFRDNIFS